MKKIIYSLSAGILAMPVMVSARYVPPEDSRGTFDGSIGDAVRVALGYIMSGIAIISIIGIVVGGLMYVLSAGDEEKTKSAKGIILASVIGLVVTLLAFAIVYTIDGLFGAGGGESF